MNFEPLVVSPGMLFAHTDDSGGLHIYSSPIVDLMTDDIAESVRKILETTCYRLVPVMKMDDEDMFDGVGEYVHAVTWTECPGEDFPHVHSAVDN